MEHAIGLVAIFAVITFAHYAAHNHALHSSVPWALLIGHPVTLDTLRELAIHTFVYSPFAPF